MKTAIVMLCLILGGCSGLVYRDAPFDAPFSGMFFENTMKGSENLPALRLYRPVEETPRLVKVGFTHVRIFDKSCYRGAGEATTVHTGDYTVDLYLCGTPYLAGHELAHADGMEHGDWQTTGGGKCAQVISSDRAGKYRTGDWICVANGHEWTERQ